MNDNKALSIIDKILKVYVCFFQGVGWFFKTCAKGIATAFIFLGKYVNIAIEYGIIKSFKKLGELIKKLGQIIKGFFKKIGNKINNGKEGYNKSNFNKKVHNVVNFIPNLLASKITYRKRQALWGIVFLIPLLIGFVYFFLLPFINTVVFSFCNVNATSPNVYNGKVYGTVSEFVGIDNYRFVWKVHATFKDTLKDTFLKTFVDVIMILIFSLIIAVVLNSKFKGRAFVRAVFFMPVIFNSQAITQATAYAVATETLEESGQDIFTQMFNFKDLLINAHIPMVFVNFLSGTADSIFQVISNSGVQILIFLSGIQSVSKQLYEAAKIEGATQYEIFWKITFPMVSPLMLTAGVYTVVDSFMRSDLLKIMSKYSSQAPIYTYTLGLGNLTNDGIYAAMSVLFCLVSLALVSIVLILLKVLVFYYDE